MYNTEILRRTEVSCANVLVQQHVNIHTSKIVYHTLVNVSNHRMCIGYMQELSLVMCIR